MGAEQFRVVAAIVASVAAVAVGLIRPDAGFVTLGMGVLAAPSAFNLATSKGAGA